MSGSMHFSSLLSYLAVPFNIAFSMVFNSPESNPSNPCLVNSTTPYSSLPYSCWPELLRHSASAPKTRTWIADLLVSINGANDTEAQAAAGAHKGTFGSLYALHEHNRTAELYPLYGARFAPTIEIALHHPNACSDDRKAYVDAQLHRQLLWLLLPAVLILLCAALGVYFVCRRRRAARPPPPRRYTHRIANRRDWPLVWERPLPADVSMREAYVSECEWLPPYKVDLELGEMVWVEDRWRSASELLPAPPPGAHTLPSARGDVSAYV